MKEEAKEKLADEIVNSLSDKRLYMGRMISPSKSTYNRANPKNEIAFNGNIIADGIGKIWWGDVDVTLSQDDLRKVAEKYDVVLYVLREHACRFNTEDDPIETLMANAMWNSKDGFQENT